MCFRVPEHHEIFCFDIFTLYTSVIVNFEMALINSCVLVRFTGKNHGVFVLPELDVTAVGEVIESHCHEVLQKPSFKLMKDKNAILKGKWVL